MQLFVSRKIRVASSPVHGLGVFAMADFQEGELIEECPFLELPIGSMESSPIFVMHRFNYPAGPLTEKTKQVLVLGYGSLYNHSDNNNAYWVTDESRRTFKFYARRPIRSGEEIFTYYGGPEYWKDGRDEAVNLIPNP